MPPPGGLADKIGNRYEGRIAVGGSCSFSMSSMTRSGFRFERPGDDRFEWWVQRGTDRALIRRSSGSSRVDEEWTIGTLVSRGVIPAFGQRLA